MKINKRELSKRDVGDGEKLLKLVLKSHFTLKDKQKAVNDISDVTRSKVKGLVK